MPALAFVYCGFAPFLGWHCALACRENTHYAAHRRSMGSSECEVGRAGLRRGNRLPGLPVTLSTLRPQLGWLAQPCGFLLPGAHIPSLKIAKLSPCQNPPRPITLMSPR